MSTWPRAGPISKGDVQRNVARGVQAGLWLLRHGIAVYVPHLNVRPDFPPAEPGGAWYETLLSNDISYVLASDAVLRLRGPSAGADRECAAARKAGIPVFTSRVKLLRALRAR